MVSGSLQLAAALLAVRDQKLHRSVGFEQIDPELGIAANREPRAASLKHILLNSISAGGGIVSAVISKEAA